MSDLHTADRVTMVDDMICDCIQSLSLKRHRGKERQIIERCAQRIVERVDASKPMTVTASGSVKLDA